MIEFYVPVPTKELQILGGKGDDLFNAELGLFTPRFYVDGQAGNDSLVVDGGQYAILGYAVETVDMIDGALQETLQVVVDDSEFDVYRNSAGVLYIGTQQITEPSRN